MKYSENKKEYMKEYLKEYRKKKRVHINEMKKLWYKNNKWKRQTKEGRQHMNEIRKRYYYNNIEKEREYYVKNRERILKRNTLYNKNNRLGVGHYNSPELIQVMINVRIRDNNTCQWYGCGLKHKATKIDVHHIFPRSEYPNLSNKEQYMICYCREHHAQFHAARGDNCQHLLKTNNKKNTLEYLILQEVN